MSDKPLEVGERGKRIRVGPDTACHGCTGIVTATGPYFSVMPEGELPTCYYRDRQSACHGAEENWQRIPEDTAEAKEDLVEQSIEVGDEIEYAGFREGSACRGCRGVVTRVFPETAEFTPTRRSHASISCNEKGVCGAAKECMTVVRKAAERKEQPVGTGSLIGKMVVYEGRLPCCRGCKGVVRTVDERDTAHIDPRERACATGSIGGSPTCAWRTGNYSVIDDAERKEAQMSDQQMRFVTYSVEKVAGEETKDTGRGCETLPRPRESILPKDGKEPFERIWTNKTGPALYLALLKLHHADFGEVAWEEIEFVEQTSGKVIE